MGGRTHLLLASVVWPLTTHPSRGRAQKGRGGARDNSSEHKPFVVSTHGRVIFSRKLYRDFSLDTFPRDRVQTLVRGTTLVLTSCLTPREEGVGGGEGMLGATRGGVTDRKGGVCVGNYLTSHIAQ